MITSYRIFEKRVYKNLSRYKDFFKNYFNADADKVMCYEEDGIKTIVLEFNYFINSDLQSHLKVRKDIEDIFNGCEIQYYGKLGTAIYKILGISDSIFKRIELMVDAKKYNI